LNRLPAQCSGMEASRAWFCFWGCHSLRMLNHSISPDLAARLISFLKCCETSEGGYSGAPGQIPHLATTYAAVMTLISIGTTEALDSIDRAKLLKFLHSVKQPNGSFAVHEGGETDIRGVYCAVAVAFATGIASEKLLDNTAYFAIRCQTYEGGFAGEPNCEAHGGYTLCGVAALALLGKTHLMDDEALTRWLVNRQMQFEGGFQGRTGKLVDVCYSYWQAAACVIAEIEIEREWNILPKQGGLFNETALQDYDLGASQTFQFGGFCDKPEKHPDLYHTCYALSGLSLAQESLDQIPLVGGQSAALRRINPLLNVCAEEAKKARTYFEGKPITIEK